MPLADTDHVGLSGSQRQVITFCVDLIKYNSLTDINRVTSLKTYSRRVNKSLSAPAAKEISQKDSSKKKVPFQTAQRRVSRQIDEKQCHVSYQQHKRFLIHRSALITTSSNPQREALLDIDLNSPSVKVSRTSLEQSQKGGALHATSLVPQRLAPPSEHIKKGSSNSLLKSSQHASKSYRAISYSSASVKAIASGLETSPLSETKRKEEGLSITTSFSLADFEPGLDTHGQYIENGEARQIPLSCPTTPESPLLEYCTLSPNNRLKKRQHFDFDLPKLKKAKASSIKAYFKPLSTISSPALTQSINTFSEKVDKLSSPPTSPISESENSEQRPSGKKPRRHLSIKPSLPPPDSMDYEGDFTKLEDLVGNMDDDAWVQQAERFLDERDRFDQEKLMSTASPINDDHVQRAKDFKDVKDKLDLEYYRRVKTPILRSQPIDIPMSKIPKPIIYEQLRLNTFKDVSESCSFCDFKYNQTIPAEVKEHSHRHEKRAKFLRDTKGVLSNPIWEEDREDGEHRIHVNRRHTKAKERNWFEQHLEISEQRGLAGLLERDLWNEKSFTDHFAPPRRIKANEKPKRKLPRYKVYAYTVNHKVISIAVVQHISEAAAYYYGPKTHDEDGKLAVPNPGELVEYVDMDRSFRVVASIDRLWTEEKYRRKGHATTLLNCILGDFIPCYTLRKSQLAFSSPTTEGREFATKYFESVFSDCPFVIDVHDARMVVQNEKLKDLWDAGLKLKKDLSSRSLFPLEN